jgi:hypothetical protein
MTGQQQRGSNLEETLTVRADDICSERPVSVRQRGGGPIERAKAMAVWIHCAYLLSHSCGTYLRTTVSALHGGGQSPVSSPAVHSGFKIWH